MLVPIWGMLRLAFDGALKGAPTELSHLARAIFAGRVREGVGGPVAVAVFLGLLRNSLIVAGGAALFSVALGASMAYAFARFRFPGRRAGLFGLLVGACCPRWR